MSAAARLFLQRSYQAVGVDEICEAADARKGSFYYYFSSKCELAKAVVDLHAVTYASRLADFADDDPVRRLRAIPDMIGAVQVDFESQFGRAVGCPFGNLAAELSTTDDALRAHIAGCFRLMEEGLAQLCRQASAQGLFAKESIPIDWPTACLPNTRGDPARQTQRSRCCRHRTGATRLLAAYLSDGGHAR